MKVDEIMSWRDSRRISGFSFVIGARDGHLIVEKLMKLNVVLDQ
jgi:hypothetical protein